MHTRKTFYTSTPNALKGRRRLLSPRSLNLFLTLGNRDYTLFEVVHHGLRLPAVISSFGDVFNASLSSWRAVRPFRPQEDAEDENLLAPNKSDIFNARAMLKLPRTVDPSDLQNISFYCFWRLYHSSAGRLHKRQKEKILSP